MASFDIVLRTRGSLHPGGEPSEFVSGYTGVIVCTDDETGEETRVGKVAALRVHAALAHNAGESLFDVCDSHSQELHVLHTLLYEPDRYHFRDDIMARFDAAEPDLLVLDYVVLSPKWRRLKLGLLAVRKLVDMIGGGCGLAVSLIAPLRHDAAKFLKVPAPWLPRHPNTEERRAAAVRLRGYYRRMGFRRLGRTPYYALPLNQVTPNAGELLGGTPPGL
ncbi:MAG: hypothetical protein JWO38_8097 [Gemmataceae bacterium]|nr:hypothetical protein [Gemmataceae bacterium]